MLRRTALVTGGGSDVGKATGHRLVRDGMAVGVLDLDVEAARRAAQEIREAGGEALALQADISDRGRGEAAVAEVRRAFGAVTVVVNNATIESWAA